MKFIFVISALLICMSASAHDLEQPEVTNVFGAKTYFVGATCEGFSDRDFQLEGQYSFRSMKEVECGEITYVVLKGFSGTFIALSKEDVIPL